MVCWHSLKIDDLTLTIIIVAKKWHDSRLQWNASDYNDIKVISLGNEEIWKPYINLISSLDPGKDPDSLYILANNDGTAVWTPCSTIRVQCLLDLANYPFDKQYCSLLFISLAARVIEISPLNGKFDLIPIMKSIIWFSY